MIVWRLCKRRHSSREAILAGEGARRTGGRWNEKGLAVIYACSSSSLGLLEQLVRAALTGLPKSLVAVAITVPENASTEEIDPARLPKGWRNVANAECVALGSAWIRRRSSLLLSVPSAANPLERNILLHPGHPEARQCKVGAPIQIAYDPRLATLFQA